jgi:hypothetical protein
MQKKSVIARCAAEYFNCRTAERLNRLIEAMYRLARFVCLEKYTLHRIIGLVGISIPDEPLPKSWRI